MTPEFYAAVVSHLIRRLDMENGEAGAASIALHPGVSEATGLILYINRLRRPIIISFPRLSEKRSPAVPSPSSRTRRTSPATPPLFPEKWRKGPTKNPRLPDIERSWNTIDRARTERILPCRRSKHSPCIRALVRSDPIPTTSARSRTRQGRKLRRWRS